MRPIRRLTRLATALVIAATGLVPTVAAVVVSAPPAGATPAGLGVTDTITIGAPSMTLARGIAADGNGNVWIVSQTSQQVIRIDSATRAVSHIDISSCVCTPWSVTIDGDDSVWVGSNDTPGTLIHLSRYGVIQDTHVAPTTSTNVEHGGFKSLAYVNGKLWFTGLSYNSGTATYGSEVGYFDTDTSTFTHYTSGTTDSATTGLFYPQSIVEGPGGNMWVVNYGDPPSRGRSVSKISTTTGAVTTYDGSAYLNGPVAIINGGDGNLYIANEKYGSATGSVVRVSTAGTFTEYTDASLSGVAGATWAKDGRVWILSSTAVTGFNVSTHAFTPYTIPSGTSARSITSAADGALWYPEGNTSEVRTTGIGLPQKPLAPVVYSSDSTHVTATVVTGSTFDGGSPITSWALYASNGSYCTTTLPAAACSITGLTAGTEYYFDIVFTNANGASYTSPSAAFIPGGSGFTTLASPVRIFDSRNGTGTTAGAFGAGEHRSLVVTGHNGVPATATAVVLNLGATGASVTAGGWAAVAPTAGSFTAPTISNLNFASDRAYSNAVTVAVGTGGSIDFYNKNGTVQLFADLIGYFDTTTGSTLIAITPSRVFDTRSGTGTTSGRFTSGEHRDFDVVTAAALPPAATAVVFNVTATSASALTNGWAAVVPTPAGAFTNPTTSNLNFTSTSGAVATMVTCGIGSGGKVSFFNKNGDTHLIGDLVGYYVNDGSGARYFPLTPSRVIDTRFGTGSVPIAPIGASASLSLTMTGRGSVPTSSGVAAVLMNLTSARASTTGWFGVYPASTAHGSESSVNFLTGRAAANLVLGTLDANGAIDVYNRNGTADAIIDLAGYFAGTPTFGTS